MIVQKDNEKLFNLYKILVGMDDGLKECPSISTISWIKCRRPLLLVLGSRGKSLGQLNHFQATPSRFVMKCLIQYSTSPFMLFLTTFGRFPC